MKPYAPLVTNTGTSEPDRVAVIERMYNGEADPQVNLPLSTLQACVKSQVGLLYRMERDGVLLSKRQVEATLSSDRQRAALGMISNSVAAILCSRPFANDARLKKLRPGMQAIVDEAEEALK